MSNLKNRKRKTPKTKPVKKVELVIEKPTEPIDEPVESRIPEWSKPEEKKRLLAEMGVFTEQPHEFMAFMKDAGAFRNQVKRKNQAR